MQHYTVIGLVDDEGRLTVAGVIEGKHNTVDSQLDSTGGQRWASSFYAADPDEAEKFAREETLEDAYGLKP